MHVLLGEILIWAPDLKGENYPPKDCPVHLQLILPAFLLFSFLPDLPCFLAPKGCFIHVTGKSNLPHPLGAASMCTESRRPFRTKPWSVEILPLLFICSDTATAGPGYVPSLCKVADVSWAAPSWRSWLFGLFACFLERHLRGNVSFFFPVLRIQQNKYLYHMQNKISEMNKICSAHSESRLVSLSRRQIWWTSFFCIRLHTQLFWHKI